jgi:quercetin dioxygenase-like cupin family protein
VEHQDWLERAEFFALSTLDGEELTQFDAHLSSGCNLCLAKIRETEEMLARLPVSLEVLKAPDGVKRRVFEQIDNDKAGYHFVYDAEGEWREMEPGVFAKLLYMDAGRQRVTALVRMKKGSRSTNHRHTQTEEILVLEGSCYCGGQLMQKGDYHRAEAGSIHLDTHTDEGSLMLIITSAQNEMLA